MYTNPSPHRCPRLAIALALTCALMVLTALGGCARRPAEPVPQQPTATPATTTVLPSATPQPEPPTATPAPEPTPVAPAPSPVKTTTVRAFFVRGEFLGLGRARTANAAAPARGALLQLLAGPTAAEKSWGLSTQIPSGTKLLGISIANGVATADFSKRFESGGGTLSMTLRIAQVVNTLTQFDGVNAVAFRIDGKKVSSIGGEGIVVSPPVGRADFPDSLPAIMLESPLPGSTIRSPVRILGSADVFEAHFIARITDAAGKVVAEKPVKATSGTGTRGTFNSSIPFKVTKHGKGWITVFERSAKDGMPIHVVKIRVSL